MLHCQAPWEGSSWTDLSLVLAPGGRQAQSAGFAANGGTGRGEGAGEKEHGPKSFGALGLRRSQGLGGPQSPVWWRQAPWEGPLRDRPWVRVTPQYAGKPDALAVQQVEGQAESRALAIGSVGSSLLVRGPSKVSGGSEGPSRSSALNDRRHPNWPGWRRGSRLSLMLGLWGPQSPALWRQAPWEGPLGGQPRVKVSPQEAGRPDPPAVRRAVGRA